MTDTPNKFGRLIALYSPAMGSGKSTVAEHLVAEHEFVPISFAAPLKRMTTALLDCFIDDHADVMERVYGARKEEIIPLLGKSSRYLQQTLGTEWGRNLISESMWCDMVFARAHQYRMSGISVVVDDMRFPNEYEGVLKQGGETWRIIRPGTVVTHDHSSEGRLEGRTAHQVIANDGTVQALWSKIDNAISRAPGFTI
jgi:hypothetical protein